VTAVSKRAAAVGCGRRRRQGRPSTVADGVGRGQRCRKVTPPGLLTVQRTAPSKLVSRRSEGCHCWSDVALQEPVVADGPSQD